MEFLNPELLKSIKYLRACKKVERNSEVRVAGIIQLELLNQIYAYCEIFYVWNKYRTKVEIFCESVMSSMETGLENQQI